MDKPARLLVVAAIIERDGLILCARRGPGRALPGLWEFPGGKVEAGEGEREALVREIREELGVSIEVGEFVTEVDHDYGDFSLKLRAYRAAIRGGEAKATEHEELRWLPAGRLGELDWAAADLPVVAALRAS
jgi:8-oxo-dGTP diphosphatase